jgi:hypothetical protein
VGEGALGETRGRGRGREAGRVAEVVAVVQAAAGGAEPVDGAAKMAAPDPGEGGGWLSQGRGERGDATAGAAVGVGFGLEGDVCGARRGGVWRERRWWGGVSPKERRGCGLAGRRDIETEGTTGFWHRALC